MNQDSERVAEGHGKEISVMEYDPEIDNCANMPGCGDERVLFAWFGPAICCPRCYENVFGGPPEGLRIVKVPAPAGAA